MADWITITEGNRAAAFGRQEHWLEHHTTFRVVWTDDTVPWEFTAPTVVLVVVILLAIAIWAAR